MDRNWFVIANWVSTSKGGARRSDVTARWGAKRGLRGTDVIEAMLAGGVLVQEHERRKTGRYSAVLRLTSKGENLVRRERERRAARILAGKAA